jgi:hypothetical protein
VYGTLTGAKNQFGFFAPRVSSPSRIRIKVSFADRAPKVQLFQARTIEGRSRFSGLLQRLRDLKDVDYRRVAAAAVAAYMFDQWPAALSVTVQLESLYIPSLPECRKGINSNWNLVFSATFNQGSKSDNSIRHKENY